MRSVFVPAGLLVIALTAAPVFAQRGNSGNHGPANHPANAGPKSNPGPKSTGTHGPSNAGNRGNGNGSPKHAPSPTTPTTTTPTTVNFATTPVGQKLTRNTALQSKLTTKLTTLGYTGTVFQAAYGFKNLGQFVAATNVSQNLGIPFDQLKLQMTGVKVDSAGNVTTSTTPTKSLGQSIQTLKPQANSSEAAKTATTEAEIEIEHSTSNSSKAPKSKNRS